MVALVPVHSWASSGYVNGLCDLCVYASLVLGVEVLRQYFPTPVGLFCLECSLYVTPQGILRFTYMFRIIVAGDVIDSPTLSFLRGLILGMNKPGPHGIGWLVIHAHTIRFEYPSQDLGCALYIGEA